MFDIIDDSDAPARGVRVSIPGLLSKNLTFLLYPVSNGSYTHPVSTLDKIVPDYYEITITPYNELGEGNSFTDEFHANGEIYACASICTCMLPLFT